MFKFFGLLCAKMVLKGLAFSSQGYVVVVVFSFKGGDPIKSFQLDIYERLTVEYCDTIQTLLLIQRCPWRH